MIVASICTAIMVMPKLSLCSKVDYKYFHDIERDNNAHPTCAF